MIPARERLHAMIRNRRLPHGLLLLGTADSDALSAALSVGRHLLCTAEESLRPCETCSACRNVTDGNHPDLLRIAPDKQELTIERIRELQIWVARGPYESSAKVAILEEADAMNAAAANALLKTLEEPPPYATLLLVAAAGDRFLPTILSRLQTVRFPSPEKEPGTGPDGEIPWLPKLREALKNPQATAIDVFALTAEIGKERESLTVFFRTFEGFLRDRLGTLQGDPDAGAEFGRTARVFDDARRAEIDLLRHYGNPALVLDSLLLRWFTHA